MFTLAKTLTACQIQFNAGNEFYAHDTLTGICRELAAMSGRMRVRKAVQVPTKNMSAASACKWSDELGAHNLIMKAWP